MKKFLILIATLLPSLSSFAKMPTESEKKSMPRILLSEQKAVMIDACIGGSLKLILDSSVETISTINQSNLDSFWTSVLDDNRTVFIEVGPKVIPGDGTVLSLYKPDITKYLVNVKSVRCSSGNSKEVILTK